jgi:general secretion pathway protein C
VKFPLRQKGCGKLQATFHRAFYRLSRQPNIVKFLTNLPSQACRRRQSGRVSVALAVAWLLGFALLLRAGLPLWGYLAAKPAADLATATADPATGRHAPDLAALQSLALFDSGAIVTDAARPALNTALNLRLEGVILAGNGANSMAVIVSGDQRGSYRAGDTLPAGANVLVDSIARDHVVIDNRGQREVLWLFEGAETTPAAGTAITGNAAGFVLPPGSDQRVVRTAARLAEIISVAPEQVNGQLVGYRVTPGARLKEFVQLGFETNDIVTAVDGIALNDIANMPKLYGLMDGATEVSFSLLRNGTPLNLKVTLETAAN